MKGRKGGGLCYGLDFISSGDQTEKRGQGVRSEGNQGNGVELFISDASEKGIVWKERERKEDEVFVSKERGSGGRKEEEKLKRETREDDSANAESAVLLTNYVT